MYSSVVKSRFFFLVPVLVLVLFVAAAVLVRASVAPVAPVASPSFPRCRVVRDIDGMYIETVCPAVSATTCDEVRVGAHVEWVCR